jgi:hypothetical protein
MPIPRTMEAVVSGIDANSLLFLLASLALYLLVERLAKTATIIASAINADSIVSRLG